MELCLDTIKELNAVLAQLANVAKEWNSSTPVMIRLPASLQKLWDEICILKCLAADIQRSLERGVMLDIDKCDLLCINQAVAAASCLLGEACNSVSSSPYPTPLELNPEDLERYLNDIRDCRTHIESTLRPRLGYRPAFKNPYNFGVTGKCSEGVLSSANGYQDLIASTAGGDAPVRDSSSSPTASLLSLLDSINFISRKVPRGRCSSRCQCVCHRFVKSKANSEGSPNSISAKCSKPQCRSRESRNTVFVIRDPILLQREFVLSLVSRGVQMSYGLKTRPIVPASSAVIKCAENGDLDSLKMLLFTKKASIYDTEPDGWSLLHSAVNNSNFEVVKFLLDWGADRDVTEVKFRKPSHFAKFRTLNHHATENEKEVFRLFGDDNDDFKLDFGLSPVLAATLNEYDTSDCERLSLQEFLQHAQFLAVSGRSDYNTLKSEYIHRSPLYLEVIRHCEVGANKKEPGGSLIQELIDQPDEIQGWTPLLWAAYTGRVREVGILLDHGADPLKITQAGRNIFHHAAEAANIDVLEYLLRQGCIEKGVDINLRDYWGETPLHIATVRSSDLVKVLLEHGAQIGKRQGSGELALHYLRHLEGEARLKTLENLLTALQPNSPLINSVNDVGYPCLFYLLDTPECVKILLNRGADITLVDQKDRNVLHHACMKNHQESLCLLLEHCSVDMVTAIHTEGDTPLLTAFRNNAIDCVLTLLGRYHHLPQTVDKDGWTFLHHALRLNYESIVDHVLSIPGIDRKARTKMGQTTNDIAEEYKCSRSVREKIGRF